MIGVYAAGKSAGHIEVLQDPDGMRKQLVESYVMRSYSPGDKGGESGDTHHSPPPVVIYDARNSLYRRVSSIGARVLAAARDHVQAQSAELARRIAQLERDLEAAASTGAGSALERTVVVGSNESRATSSDEAWRQLVVAKEEAAYWQEAAKRLSGQWQWVVTNSLAVNAFVTPVRALNARCTTSRVLAGVRAVRFDASPYPLPRARALPAGLRPLVLPALRLCARGLAAQVRAIR